MHFRIPWALMLFVWFRIIEYSKRSAFIVYFSRMEVDTERLGAQNFIANDHVCHQIRQTSYHAGEGMFTYMDRLLIASCTDFTLQSAKLAWAAGAVSSWYFLLHNLEVKTSCSKQSLEILLDYLHLYMWTGARDEAPLIGYCGELGFAQHLVRIPVRPLVIIPSGTVNIKKNWKTGNKRIPQNQISTMLLGRTYREKNRHSLCHKSLRLRGYKKADRLGNDKLGTIKDPIWKPG